jgi:hypothetical protein
MEQVLLIFAEFGIFGLIIGYLLWMIGKKEDRINDLTDKLVDKSESDVDRFTKMTLTMERILMAVQGVGK